MFNRLFEDRHFQVIWFHDSFAVIPMLISELKKPTFLIFSWSWYASETRINSIFATITEHLAQVPNAMLCAHDILFLMNSASEYESAFQKHSGFQIALVNNTCFLDMSLFFLRNEHVFDAVYNAKGLAFKRHFLTEEIDNKCFITYDVSEVDFGITSPVDLDALAPKALYRSIGRTDVAAILGKCAVGLILSEEEGACYASTEYLLAGLPVVSTISLGGRDQFYDSKNCIIVNPDPTSVKQAVAELVVRNLNDPTLRVDIQRNAQALIQKYRTNFFDGIRALVRGKFSSGAAIYAVKELISKHDKMINYRNFFVQVESTNE